MYRDPSITTDSERQAASSVDRFKLPVFLECSKCGADAMATCDCGVAYVPAGTRAAAAVAANPEKSDRSIADEIGVSPTTVGKARKATVHGGQLAKRVGKDGKARKLPQRPAANDDTSADQRKAQYEADDQPAPSCTTGSPELDHDEGDSPEQIWVNQLVYRVKEALRMARESLEELPDGLQVSAEMELRASVVVVAWAELAEALSKKRAVS